MNTRVESHPWVTYRIKQSRGIFDLIVQTGILIGVLGWFSLTSPALGATSITHTVGQGDLGTRISQSANSYSITGGKPFGVNLLHSFDQFSIATGDIAQFRTLTLSPDTAVHNILGRITGSHPSSIFGTVDSASYYPNANLFLVNPNGIVFGPSATLNVGGSVSVTTADYIRFFDGTHRANFYADPAKDPVTANGYTSILSVSPLINFGFVTPAAFGFLNSTPAAISVQGSKLSVRDGQSLSLIGGNQGFTYSNPDNGSSPSAAVPNGITINSGSLTAKAGQLNIASIASPGEILATTIRPSSHSALGTIRITQGSLLNVSNDTAGTIRIRGGRLEIRDSTLSANTHNGTGSQAAVDIKVQGELYIEDTRGQPVITATSTGHGQSKGIAITASDINATSDSNAEFIMIDSRSLAGGRGGDIVVRATNTISASNTAVDPNGFLFFIDSGIAGSNPLNNGGNLSLSSRTVHFKSISISAGDLFDIDNNQASGAGGDLSITADRLDASFSRFDTGSFTGKTAGAITLNVGELTGNHVVVSAIGSSGGGMITLNSDKIFLGNSSVLESDVLSSGKGGGITIDTKILELRNGSEVVSFIGGKGEAGPITITATDHVTMAGSASDSNPTGLFSNAVGKGDAGSVILNTPSLEMSGGARINTITEGSGHGGKVTLTVTGNIYISGEYPFNLPEPIFGIGTIGPSGIFTKTRGSDPCMSKCGDAGNISINAQSLTLDSGAQIDSGTTNHGHGGTITIEVGDNVSLSGTLKDGSPVGIFSRTTGTSPGAGSGGNISLTVGRSISVRNGAAISASSDGPGAAGNVTINAGQQLNLQNGSITTQSNQLKGGNIDIRAIDLIRLTNSTISASALVGSGNGGNISIDPNLVLLQNNSRILAQAKDGNGGNITITTPLFLADQSSRINADSQFGLNGTVTIQSPTSNLSGTVGQLTSTPSPVHLFVQNRCVALAHGQPSTLIVSGRPTFSTTPGGWMSSPTLMAIETDEPLRVRGEERIIGRFSASENDVLSLRRLTPQGFLVRSFANGVQTGCRL